MIRERQRQILEYVQKSRIASLAQLAKNHEVSEFTIRRDIDYLAENGLLAKIKGGAKAIETPLQVKEAKITHRLQTNIAEKEIIARRGIEEIKPGDTLFLDGSSTIVTLARFIAKQCTDITVVTNSILISL
jgi:DeoR/GlpR family transcriptional regulator of sugar metabolism